MKPITKCSGNSRLTLRTVTPIAASNTKSRAPVNEVRRSLAADSPSARSRLAVSDNLGFPVKIVGDQYWSQIGTTFWRCPNLSPMNSR